MKTDLHPPFAPMEATAVGENWQYEPKWDGFRCVAFRSADSVELQSKSGQPLARYFPDLVDALTTLGAKRFVLDGEIVIPVKDRLAFDELLLRIHPAKSRVQKLAAEHPAVFIVFDLLADERGKTLIELPLSERRQRLERFAARYFGKTDRIRVSPAARDLPAARKWFNSTGGNLDGIIAKRIDLPYRAGQRDAMQKIKHRRTADCVVGGFRYAEKRKVVGSLLLGLYDDEGLLDHVGFTSSFREPERKKITDIVEPLIHPPGFTGHAPGGPSRWSTRRSDEWKPLRPKLVVEVEYDHFTGGRFRHGTHFLRWRPDKTPRQCTFEQVTPRGGVVRLLNTNPKRQRGTLPR
jgi:ATP-dependent DNA ligase